MSPVAIKSLAGQLSDKFMAAGAIPVETEALQPAEVLLDLYGEDIRGRAYVTDDAVNGEQMLRPDFTVPVVQMHMKDGAEPARYTYNGPVWRKQEAGLGRAKEYLQVGFELFDRTDSAKSDAEVFALFHQILKPYDLRATTGDMGVLFAAISGLNTTERRKSALRRHVWRPERFRTLLDRFGRKTTPLAHRVDLIVQVGAKGLDAVFEDAGQLYGVRTRNEIEERVATLQGEEKAAVISTEEIDLVQSILDMKGASDEALETVSQMAANFPALKESANLMDARLDALAAYGLNVNDLPFEASFGRSTMEYYDGFVFGFFDGEDNIASGGRYDAMTQVLGQGRSIPAVGGVIRPDALAAVKGGAL